MQFEVLPVGNAPPLKAKSKAYLLSDNWNDWWEFKTLYSLVLFDRAGERHEIGDVKIGQFGMKEGQTRPELPSKFPALDERFFSLGQDDSYYQNLGKLGSDFRDRVLRSLRDTAFDQVLFRRALNERVTGHSLLRGVSRATVSGQYKRLAHGEARLSRFEFTYTAPIESQSSESPISLSFIVTPESFPPTNIHVVIGRNGVGKTHLLNNMALALVEKKSQAGAFTGQVDQEDLVDSPIFANLVSVSFSAFDTFEPLPNRKDKSKGVQYTYIGLKRIGRSQEGKQLPPKAPERLAEEFGDSVLLCRLGARLSRWRRALEVLEADPVFQDAEVTELAEEELDEENIKRQAKQLFDRLSSGHKIVLLTITRLVETVEERSLVLLDEPEAHLHPPLLSAFIRAVSDLLINRNGVALIATHSPVILQEVPQTCVWKIRRSGYVVVAERPQIETFGENVGTLTREVFGLEVTQSGFHKMIQDVVARGIPFERVVQKFGGSIGGEARAIARALISLRDAEDAN